ncbi:MAG: oxidoreductase alpha (molybdopterin) subunit [Marmoricola sp.]|nr:oxidoreductase alpha (molybdopterin) subunit [Marmoricola sp.]
MSRQAPRDDIDESELRVTHPEDHAAGPTAVAVSMKRTLGAMGVRRTAESLLKLNQADGFDCQGCAWPDPAPGRRHTAEFCENGAKAVADEAMLRRADRAFWAAHPVEELRGRTDYWLGQQGRITEPMVLREGGTHYEPISWDDAFALIAEHLNGLESPDEAVFYTSGKVSNEAAFAFQLFVRAYGTNNLPDCSNMCHESTSVGLAEVIGIGKASVTLDDVHNAELLVIAGQNPGTNHPRMLSALEIAKKNGARIIAINPLKEAGLIRFKNPQTPQGVVGHGTPMADLYLQVRINGDLALFQAIASLLLEWGELDHDFIEQHTHGFEAYAEHLRALDWDLVLESSGLAREQIEEAARMIAASRKTVYCWAMGIVQHQNGVANVKEISNLAFLQGNIGKPGAGLFPVRGHSNVQGDRTMGIWEKPPAHFLDALRDEFGFEPPREHGLDAVGAVKAFRDGRAKVFFGLGGNFVTAMSDTTVTEDALRKADLTVQVSTKPNRSHVVHGRDALILPPLGRSEKDLTGGRPQRVTVEDSVCSVHASHGPLEPASAQLRSEVDIICSMAIATLGDRHSIPWTEFRDDYRQIRRRIGRMVPGCAGYEEKVDQAGGFVLPHPPRDTRTFETDVKRAVFTVSPTEVLQVPRGRLLLQTMRSQDQFNTVIYGLDDRYRGIKDGRQVVFVSPSDIEAQGLRDGQHVDIISEWEDGSTRKVERFRVVSYDTPKGCAAAYYPETNALVSLDAKAVGSNQPAYKSILVRLVPSVPDAPATGRPEGMVANESTDSGGEPKHYVAPHHLS